MPASLEEGDQLRFVFESTIAYLGYAMPVFGDWQRPKRELRL